MVSSSPVIVFVILLQLSLLGVVVADATISSRTHSLEHKVQVQVQNGNQLLLGHATIKNNDKRTTKRIFSPFHGSDPTVFSLRRGRGRGRGQERREGRGFGSNKYQSNSSNLNKPAASKPDNQSRPSFYWAVFHNWMYFLSLGFNLINIPFMIRSIIDNTMEGTRSPSPQAIALSGKVESVDKLLTFLGIGILSALSDRHGRKPLMIWSALGFGLTNWIQAQVPTMITGGDNNNNIGSAIAALYFADMIDGCSSCMLPVCQAYVVDCSSKSQTATNLGIFQGLSAGGAFIFAFPIGGLIGARKGPKVALLIAAAIQAVNALILVFFTPESHPPDTRHTTATRGEQHPYLEFHKVNPLASFRRLFGTTPLLRIAAGAYFLAALARGSLDSQFANYTNIRFGWTQAQSGPVLVLVGLMLALVPHLLVPRLGLRHSIVTGLLVFAMGLTGAGLAPTPTSFVMSIAVVAVGCVCLPTLQALLANLALPEERGALLGAVGALNELTGAIGSTLYAVMLARFTNTSLPGMHFLMGAGPLVLAWGLALPGLKAHKDNDALLLASQ